MGRGTRRLGAVDLATGEVLEVIITPVYRQIGGKWVRLFQEGKRRMMLEHREVHMQSYYVLSYVETMSTWNNEIPSAAELAGVLKLGRTVVARAYGELRKAGFIIKKGTRYYLSPLVAWKGNERQLEEACRELFAEMRSPKQLEEGEV